MIWQALLRLPARLFRRRTEPQPNTTPLPALNTRAYLGRWYEQARYEHSFEYGLDGVYTTYTLSDNGGIRVLNVGFDKAGNEHHANGMARPKGNNGAELAVSFVPPFRWFTAPYRVLYVNEAYTEALVSGAGDDYLWLLTRRPRPGFGALRRLLREAQRRGFNLRRLRRTKQEPYAA